MSRGGVILFRGSGADARRYLESDRSRADDYYLESGVALAELTVVDGAGQVIGAASLTPEQYAGWVDWTDPLTGGSRGVPRLAGADRKGSPRFAEMLINVPKSLSIAAALHPGVSAALDAAQADAAGEARRWLGLHSVTRVGPRGRQEVVPVELLETVAVVHHTSRAGDPHRHVHFQIGTRVFAAGKWRALDTSALMGHQQGVIRALITAVIAANPHLADTLAAHGLTLDPVSGEVVELEPYNTVMSKRGQQVEANLARLEAEWREANPGESMGPVVAARLHHKAWAEGRPAKRPDTPASEDGWQAELIAAGYPGNPPPVAAGVAVGVAVNGTQPRQVRPVALADLSMREVASRALDRCAARASTWTVHDIQQQATLILSEAGVRATPADLRAFIEEATHLAVSDCLSVLPPDALAPEHVAHLTSLTVIAAETRLRDMLSTLATASSQDEMSTADGAAVARVVARTPGLDEDQREAATAVASVQPLVIVEGAAGAGKTTMLGAAITAAESQGRKVRIVTPTRKAAQVAAEELGVPTTSVAALVHAHGFRWNTDGVWTRLAVGDTDPETGRRFTGTPPSVRLTVGERVVVDEAGMLDQDTARALLTVTTEAGATVALVGDRAQLPAVGRGSVLDIAAATVAGAGGRVHDMTGVHRFADPDYAALTVAMREGDDPGGVFDRLHRMGLIVLHESEESRTGHIAAGVRDGEAVTVATNEQARQLNESIRAERIERGLVDDARTVTGVDGLAIGAGDVIQSRKNDTSLRVVNRQTWTVRTVGEDGTVYATETNSGRKHQRTVTLPPAYVAEHAHLAYASTAYGVQGATVNASHTVLSEMMSGASVYVAITRGRTANRLHIVAGTVGEAREQFTEAMRRDRADRGLAHATAKAVEEIAGLVAEGPVKIVNDELARLRKIIDRAEADAAKWNHAAVALAEQEARHRAETERQETTVAVTQARAADALRVAALPLVDGAARAGAGLADAQQRAAHASQAARAAKGWRKRTATRVSDTARDEHATLAAAVQQRWGSVLFPGQDVTTWAHGAAERTATTHPDVVAAGQEATQARLDLSDMTARHRDERVTLRREVFAGTTSARREPARRRLTALGLTNPDMPHLNLVDPFGEAAAWQRRADTARTEVERIEAMPVDQAAAVIGDRQERQAARKEQAQRAAQQTRTIRPHNFAQRPPTTRRDPGGRGIGY